MVRSALTAGAMLLLAATSACFTPLAMPLPVPEPPAASVPAIGEYARLAEQVIEHANLVRAADDAGPLLGHDALHRAAQDYAVELAARGLLDHSSPTPGRRTMVDRIAVAGARYSAAGENLAMITAQPDHVGRQAVRLWMASPGHRHNMLTPAYTHTGVGVARDREGQWYVVQLYMVPAAEGQ